MLLDYEGRRLSHALTRSLAGERERFARLAAALDALSPLKVLGRGYAVARTPEGDVVSSVRGVDPGDLLAVRLADGSLDCRVEGKKTLRARTSGTQGGKDDGEKDL